MLIASVDLSNWTLLFIPYILIKDWITIKNGTRRCTLVRRMKIPPKPLPQGWFIPPTSLAAELHDELRKKLPPGHLLYGIAVDVVTHRDGTDAILCRHETFPNRFSLIHLSWIGNTEGDALHPAVALDGSFDDFIDYESRFYQK